MSGFPIFTLSRKRDFMKKTLSYSLSVIYYLLFGLTLVIFHPIQWLMLNLIGYNAHRKSVEALNWMLMRCLNVLGTRFTFINKHHLPIDKPCIVVTNHQGQYDIPLIIYYLRKIHPKFISKKELSRGIPSISYNLRHSNAALIDRNNKEQSLQEIKKLANYCNTHHRSVVIFPEGTRSRDGIPRRFAKAGLTALFNQMPNAVIIPATINNSWKLMRWGLFPMDIGVHVSMTVHKPMPIDGKPIDQLINEVESVILQDFTEIRERKMF